MSVFAAVCVRSASVGLIFLRWNFEAGQILYSIFLNCLNLRCFASTNSDA